ncbi:unnamed protein product [Rhizophagus irregularis]|uniref:Uncharacterized protein n=1 Tax=Rhizophagus irregularis TaxID=588596 RepID=A0A916EE21_9GLOM|nr:unnamed protein product [Rhizophagus irregularis]CAB5380435.1 unnamed protein product [Rhizophagus irregularis]CAB5386862.1 unnamed protein product [Rhizophagus irregularis]
MQNLKYNALDSGKGLLEAEATWIIRVIRITVLYMDNMDTKYPGWPILGASANDTRKKDISDDDRIATLWSLDFGNGLLETGATWIIRVIRITVLYMDDMDTEYPFNFFFNRT